MKQATESTVIQLIKPVTHVLSPAKIVPLLLVVPLVDSPPIEGRPQPVTVNMAFTKKVLLVNPANPPVPDVPPKLSVLK